MRTLRPKAVVLLSGGLDSAVTLASARAEGFDPYALTVDYGQRHRIEVQKAKLVARSLGVKGHKFLSVDLRQFGGSALTSRQRVPQAGPRTAHAPGIPATYVPARNTILLSLALAWAEVLGARAIFIGANAIDYSGYPDCRPEYLRAFEKLARLATKAGVEGGWGLELRAPLLKLSKSEIVKLGKKLGVDFSLTSSCYSPGPKGEPCGRCESCSWRKKGFREAGMIDPVARP